MLPPTATDPAPSERPPTGTHTLHSEVLAIVRKYWGFDQLRPLQEQAIHAGLEHRDSLVVLPTGGGKSLCYQVPALLRGRTDVVVSPLIALMKDQVDGLRANGYPAAALHSGMDADTLRRTEAEVVAGRYRLLFVAPERLLSSRMLQLAARIGVRAFAVDEAHCISHWGHDFRREYRQLAQLKERFPDASVHAYTATATERVRADIVAQLRLRNPALLVGDFDRPNLTYRVVPRYDPTGQVLEIVRRHAAQAVIVYCLSRRETEEMAADLRAAGLRAAAYHAGMDADARRKTQDAFAAEQIDIVVATVAFGMGIDRSDVRCVLHATMPKSIEHYQQETGRAGRDGLEAECVLLYSAADLARWEGLIEKTAANAEHPTEVTEALRKMLEEMRRFCTSLRCRHQRLVEYFGQAYRGDTCGACDVCLGEVEGLADSTVTAQKILSCVARTGEKFGIEHVVDVLLGANTERVRRWHHETLSTYGLMKDAPRRELTNLVYQLVDAGVLDRTAGDRPILRLNDGSWAVLRNQRTVRLRQPKGSRTAKTRLDEESWDGVDRGLFESLRALRRAIAAERGVPAYVVFGDATLRDLARVRPTTAQSLRRVRGVGERKLADLGARFLSHIDGYCRQVPIERDVGIASHTRREGRRRPSDTKAAAFDMFATGSSVEQVMRTTGRAASTIWSYLEEFVQTQPPATLDAWVDAATSARVVAAIQQVGSAYLRPVFEHLGGRVPYEQIRLVAAHQQARRIAP
jgi:ATP-dependent DNA helicase RecQ